MNWISHIKVRKKSSADLLREIVEQSLGHGIELLSHVELMESQNMGGVNERLAQAGLQNPAIAIRNAMMTRIVLMVAREFSEPRDTDRNLHRAIDLLSDPMVQQIFNKNPRAMADAQAHFRKCKADNRLNEIRHFRDKYTAISESRKRRRFPSTKTSFRLRRRRWIASIGLRKPPGSLL